MLNHFSDHFWECRWMIMWVFAQSDAIIVACDTSSQTFSPVFRIPVTRCAYPIHWRFEIGLFCVLVAIEHQIESTFFIFNKFHWHILNPFA